MTGWRFSTLRRAVCVLVTPTIPVVIANPGVVLGNGLSLRQKLPAGQEQSGQRAYMESTTRHNLFLRIMRTSSRIANPAQRQEYRRSRCPTRSHLRESAVPNQMGLELGRETVQNQRWRCFRWTLPGSPEWGEIGSRAKRSE